MTTERTPVSADKEMDAVIDKLQPPSTETKDEVSTPEPTEEPEEPKYPESEITKKAQSLKDKEMKSFYAERDGLKKKISELESQIRSKEDDKEMDVIFQAEKEELGDEAKAKQRDEIRRKFNARYNEFKRSEATLKEKESELSELATRLDAVGKDQLATTVLLPYIFANKSIHKLIDKAKQELIEGAETKEGMERLAKAIGAELQSKLTGENKPFKPDSGRSSGGGTGRLTVQNLRDLTPEGKNVKDLKKVADDLLDQYTKKR